MIIKLINLLWVVWFIYVVGFNRIDATNVHYIKDNKIDTVEQVSVRIMPECYCPKHCTDNVAGHVTINDLVEANALFPLYGYIQGLIESGNYPAGGKKSKLAKKFNNAFGMSFNNHGFGATAELYYIFKEKEYGSGKVKIANSNTIYYKESPNSVHKRAIYPTKLHAAQDLARWQRDKLKDKLITSAKQYIRAVMNLCYLGCGEEYAESRAQYEKLYMKIYQNVENELRECASTSTEIQASVGRRNHKRKTE